VTKRVPEHASLMGNKRTKNHNSLKVRKWRHFKLAKSRPEQPRNLRRVLYSTARRQGSCIRIPFGVWINVCVSSVFMFSCVGRGLATYDSPHAGSCQTFIRFHNQKKWKYLEIAVSCASQEGKQEMERPCHSSGG
jgi:hypothetical protein